MSDTLKKHVGKRVKAARKSAGLTQEQLAAKIEKSVETISNLERGHTAPSLDTLCLVAEALDFQIDWFLREFKNASDGSSENILIEEIDAFIQNMNELELRQVVEIVRILRSNRRPN